MGCGDAVRGRVEVYLELALSPGQHLIDRSIAFERAQDGVLALARRKIELALFAAAAQRQPAGFLAHLERLHQVGDAHLLQAALDDPRPRRALLEFLQVQAVNDFLGQPDQILKKKRLGDEVFDAVHERPEFPFYVPAAGHKDERDVTRLRASAELLIKLAAVKARHFVVGDNQVRWIVDDFEEGIGTIGSGGDLAERVHASGHQVQDQGIVVNDQNLDGFERRGHRYPEWEFPRRGRT